MNTAKTEPGDDRSRPLKLRVELGRQWLACEDAARLEAGSVIELRSHVQDEVDVYAGGRLAVRGQLVDVQGQLGVKVTRKLETV